jgi:hypothetical protein
VFGGAVWAGGLLAPAEGVLNSCVKLPSPDAEPETPGAEKPFEREAPGMAVGFVISSLTRVEAGGVVPPTKILVNSPGAPACSVGAGGGALNGAVAARLWASAAAGAADAVGGFDSML